MQKYINVGPHYKKCLQAEFNADMTFVAYAITSLADHRDMDANGEWCKMMFIMKNEFRLTDL